MTEEKALVFRRHPKASLIIITILSILILDLMVGYLFIPMDLHAFRTEHPYYHHDLLPNQSQQTAWGPISYQMRTNDLGFRDREVRQVSPASDKFRILLMGDSHTEAVGTPFEHSFAGILADKFNSDSVEVLNAGVVSYSPKLYFLKTKYLLEQVHLKVDALYVFIDISDIQNAYAYQDFEPSEEARSSFRKLGSAFLAKHSFLFYRINAMIQQRERDKFHAAIMHQDALENNTVDLYRSFFNDFDDEVLLGNPDFHTTMTDWYSDEMLYQRWGRAGIELMTRHMNQLVNLCEAHDVELTISVHPWRANIRKGNDEDEHVTYWRSFAIERSVGFINFYPLFMGHLHPDSAIQHFYLPQDNHWNAAGHRKISESLIPYVQSQIRACLTTDSSRYLGIKYLAWHDYDRALATISMELLQDPNNVDLFCDRARSYIGLNDYHQASMDLVAALAIDSSCSIAKDLLADLDHLQGISELTSLRIDSRAADSLFLERGMHYLYLGHVQEAEADFSVANRLNTKKMLPYYFLGLIEYRYKADYKKASTYLNRAIQIDPEYKDAYLLRADLLETLGNPKSAHIDRERIRTWVDSESL